MDNANPTVLNVTNLPTRRGVGAAGSQKCPGSEIKELMDMKPVLNYESELSDPESASESDDDETIEPIDEQEIYGKYHMNALS